MSIVIGLLSDVIQILLGWREGKYSSLFLDVCLCMRGYAQALVYTWLSEFQTEEEERGVCQMSMMEYADSLTFHCANKLRGRLFCSISQLFWIIW